MALSEKYVILNTLKKVSETMNQDGSIDYVVRRGWMALPIEEAERFIKDFQSETSKALRAFEVETEDVLGVVCALRNIVHDNKNELKTNIKTENGVAAASD